MNVGDGDEGGDGQAVIFLTDQNFPAILPTATGKCLAIARIEHGTLKDLTDLLLAIAPEKIPAGTIFVLGSLTHLQCEGLQGYSNSGVKYGKKITGIFRNTTAVLFIPPPMGGCANSQLVRSIMDGCNWLCNIPSYPLKNSMKSVMKIVNEGAGGGTVPLSNRDDQVVYLPANTDDYSGAYMTSPGRCNIPATTPPWTGMSEKKFVDELIGDLNRNLLAGRDSEPNLSRSASRPAIYVAIRTGAVESAIFVGGSNAKELAYQASANGLDSYQITKSGWKITKENVEKLLPDLRDVLGSVPPDTPVGFFCLDNSAFMGLKDNGSTTHISKCVEGDDGYHVQGALIVAPDKAMKFTMDQLRRMIDICGDHPVFIISPWPRYVRCPCCSEVEHCTNFSEEDFIKTILADLNKLGYQLRKVMQPATVLDGLELICGGGYSREKAAQTIQSGWNTDPVHPGHHI